MTLPTVSRALTMMAVLLSALVGEAATINVTTTADEDNGNVAAPASLGCSLREALQEISLNNGLAYNGCTAATVGGPNTINISGAGGTIVVNSLVFDPSVPGTGLPKIRKGLLPFIGAAGGPITIIGAGTITCDVVPNGDRIFTEVAGASLTLTNLTMGGAGATGCTTGGAGAGIQNTGGDLTLNTVTFNNVHSNSGGQGGAIFHSGGNLNINNGIFLNNGTSDTASPSAETGDGGAIFISNVELPKLVNINNTSFTTNVAANNGGAIFWTQGDSLGHTFTITNGIFTSNVANGGTAEGGESERGGGAIYATTDANFTLTHLDLFLIANGQFLTNVAQHGQGGAILLAGGQLSSIDPVAQQPAALFPATGGVIASDFSLNVALGAAASDALGGAGGAIYARGNLSIEQSSFEGNASPSGSGGGIALRNNSTPNFVNLANVTFNSNTADQAGGAIANLDPSGSVTLVNDTLAGNTANSNLAAGNTIAGGGAIFNANLTAAAFGVRNTILGNSGTGLNVNCAGQPINDLGNNLQYSPNTAGCGASMTIADPNLASPSIFGGPNLFVKVMTINGNHSPAQGTGDQPTCAAQPILDFDATGLPAKRPSGDPNCDIGAFESGTAFPVDLKSFGAE